MSKKAFILATANGTAVVNDDGLLTCRVEDGSLQFYIEPSHLSQDGNISVNVAGETYDIPKCQYISVEDDVEGKSSTPMKRPATCVEEEISTRQRGEPSTSGGTNDKFFFWTEAATKLFLSIYKEYKVDSDTKKFKKKGEFWIEMSKRMMEMGYQVSPMQTENKFKTLERAYKNSISNNKKTGRSRAICAFESELHDLFANKHKMKPVALIGRSGIRITSESSSLNSTEDGGENSNLGVSPSPTPASQSTPSTSSSKPREGKLAATLAAMKDNFDELNAKIDKEIKIKEELLQEIRLLRESQEKSQRLMQEANVERRRKNDLLEEFLKRQR